jgi:hypothetical protein
MHSSVAIQRSLAVPGDEQELIQELQRIKRTEDITSIVARWTIGSWICGVYEKKYGEDVLRNLAKETGFSKGILYKSVQFATAFSQEQVKALTQGSFSISWRNVANNMVIGSAKLVEVYAQSKDLRTFCHVVRSLKPKKSKDEQKPRLRPRSELEEEIKGYEELVAEKDQEIADLNARIAELEDQLAVANGNYAEDENMTTMDMITD